jgi:hypothetical protein
VLAQTNPLSHAELVAIGSLHGEAPGPVMKFETLEGGALLGTALYPLVGVIDNQSDTEDVIISFSDSATVGGAFTLLTARVNGAGLNNITVPPKGRVQFALETLSLAKPFLRVSNSGTGFGRVALHSFVGRMIHRELP